MARCNCSGNTCSCVVLAGSGTEVSGSGHPADPYIISNTSLAGALAVRDTPTVDLAVTGSGVPGDPYTIAATATVALTALTDRDTSRAPVVGDVPVWQGSQWRFAPPPVAPAGTTNTSNGIIGTGAVNNPVQAATSGVWGSGPLADLGSDSTSGRVIYVDSAGQLRAAPSTTDRVDWSRIDNKPTFFPTEWNAISGRPTTFPTVWTQVDGRPRLANGAQMVPALNPQGEWSVEVTFPAALFSVVPAVFVTTAWPELGYGAVATFTGARITVRNVSTTRTSPSTALQWVAMQMPTAP